MEKVVKIFRDELPEYLNKEIETCFLVTDKELRESKNGNYLRLRLADTTGNVMGNVWNNAISIAEKFESGDIVKIKGTVISYRDQLQVTVQKARKVQDEEIDLTDFIIATDKDVHKLTERLFELLDSVSSEPLKELLKSIFEDKEFLAKFAQAPAAKSWHHNYLGGLLEHTIAVANLCEFAAHSYNVDRDLLLTGALIHDLGKVQEYTAPPAINFTDAGRLIGHIIIADQIICEKAATINNFPAELLMKLRHLVLSHHGEFEKGSARLPQILEAVILHHSDNLDAQATGVSQVINSSSNLSGNWSEFDKLNNKYYYIGKEEEGTD
ncbi:MAG: HD domain-containing protein [Candidatus Cloacimonetes bacterium]|nr:HD domain-containing protein [Candidatus Cloacimonadota bacterium]